MIRALVPSDIDAFIALRMEGLEKYPEAFGAAAEEGIDYTRTLRNLEEKNEEDFILGYFDGTALIGIVGFLRMPRVKQRHKGWVWGMYVCESHQGRGIGRALMRECIRRAFAREGLQKITLSVTGTLTGARRLYESLGFHTFGVEKNSLRVNGVGYDEIMMSLDRE